MAQQEKLEKSRIAEMGDKQQKGEYWYRFNKLENGVEGEHWSKEEKTIDAHEQLFNDKVEIEYSWTKGADGKAGKLRIYAPKAEDDKKDTGKRKSDYTKKNEEKEGYWQRKEEFEQARVTRNDKKIEMQHYQNLLAPFFLEEFKTTNATLQDIVDGLDSKATEIYNRHNPTEKAADVSAKAS